MSSNAQTKSQVTVNESENPLNINYQMLKKSSLVLRALNHKLRQQIVQIIASKGKISVTDLYIQLRIEQSVASQHLAILRKVNILITERSGKFIFYKINHDRIGTINQFIKDLVG
ncbi:MAG: transcriptional regulator [Chitinophagaceae bacterium]|nr:transcriptional regulator [Chitinophagaceae bacterium]MDB5221509.1 transcriptional regulator [Chitinophagaceae bacterium]